MAFGRPIDRKRDHADRAALWLVRSYPREHRNSAGMLYQRICEAHGMNCGNYAYIECLPSGMFLMQPGPGYPRRSDLFQIWVPPPRATIITPCSRPTPFSTNSTGPRATA